MAKSRAILIRDFRIFRPRYELWQSLRFVKHPLIDQKQSSNNLYSKMHTKLSGLLDYNESEFDYEYEHFIQNSYKYNINLWTSHIIFNINSVNLLHK